jgi:26S proteasome regulatory subunit N1
MAATAGLGIAYAGMSKEEVQEIMVPIISNESASIAEVSLAALALGLVYVGSCNDEVGTYIVQRLMEASSDDLDNSISRFLCLGLGLLYLGKTEKADAMLEIVRTVGHKRGKYCEVTLETCAYACSGNVIKVQQLLKSCAERLTENAEHQAVAVLGIALVSRGEEVGTEMAMRTFEHLLHYAELPARRVVPLAIGVLYVSNPDYSIVDQLSRLSHDIDPELAQGAILALGLVSAGSNNSRVAQLLRQAAEFYAKEANHLFCVRIAQGLNAAAKGLVTLSPFHSDR